MLVVFLIIACSVLFLILVGIAFACYGEVSALETAASSGGFTFNNELYIVKKANKYNL